MRHCKALESLDVGSECRDITTKILLTINQSIKDKNFYHDTAQGQAK